MPAFAGMTEFRTFYEFVNVRIMIYSSAKFDVGLKYIFRLRVSIALAEIYFRLSEKQVSTKIITKNEYWIPAPRLRGDRLGGYDV